MDEMEARQLVIDMTQAINGSNMYKYPTLYSKELKYKIDKMYVLVNFDE